MLAVGVAPGQRGAARDGAENRAFTLPPMTASAVLGRLLHLLAGIPGHLPLAWQRALGRAAGVLVRLGNFRSARIARRNVELVAPALAPAEREALARRILAATGANAFETLRVWTHGRAANLALVRAVRGREVLDAARAHGRGVIVAAPHYGNWELLLQYLASVAPFSLVYRVPEKRAGDVFLRLARGGPNVTLVPAESSAMRPLFRALQAGELVGITPDQQPKLGAGAFAPFFGRDALTLTLIPKLAARSRAPVVLAWAEPVDGGFDIVFEAAPAAIADDDVQVATTAMNAAVEAIARRRPEWYQWTYKRFSKRPKGSGETNPYYPDCY
jgi:KDO2-lipid IV(A) lauroyltransferase